MQCSKNIPSLIFLEAIRAQDGSLRELQALLKTKYLSFDGLVRVRNKRQEFLWVHPKYEGEYCGFAQNHNSVFVLPAHVAHGEKECPAT